MAGTIFALSFDRKTARVHEGMYASDPRIVVKDALFHYRETRTELVPSSVIAYDWVKFLLTHAAEKGINEAGAKADWVLIDYIPKFAEMCEMRMRQSNALAPFAGIANKGVWKERKLLMRDVHNLALKASQQGVIYTTYIGTDYAGQVIKEGEVFENKPKPNYQDIIEEETDCVIYQFTELDKDGRLQWMIRVESNKLRSFALKSGEVINVTGRRLSDVLKEREVKG